MDMEAREGGSLKTCPRCGAKLFADMDVCYGCLYDFTREVGPALGEVAGTSLAELASELEEPDAVVSRRIGAEPPRPVAASVPRGAEAEVLEPVAALTSPSSVRVSCGGMTVPMEVGEAGLTIGREAGCDVIVDHPAVSSRHLLLARAGDVLVARDPGAANPVLINGWGLVGTCPLRCGDVIEVRGAGVTIRPWPSGAGRGDVA